MRMLFAAAGLLLATAAVAQRGPAALPAGPGHDQVQAACSSCHEIGIVTSKRYSAAKWDELVQQMVSRGAPVSDADYDVVVAYLTKHYGDAK